MIVRVDYHQVTFGSFLFSSRRRQSMTTSLKRTAKTLMGTTVNSMTNSIGVIDIG